MATTARTVNIHEAKTHLSRLVDEVEKGESVIIAKAGKPKAQLTPIRVTRKRAVRRIGCLKGRIKIPDDFDTMFADEIEKMFSGE
jgi:prevent-host-death family protein